MAGWIAIFLLSATAGTVSWSIGHAVLPGWLIGPGLRYDLAHSFAFDFFGFPASMTVAGLAGFAGPRLFWLWGVAFALPIPVLSGVMAGRLADRGLMDHSELVGVAVVNAVVAVELAVACTLCSALGAGLRTMGNGRLTSTRGDGVRA